MTLLVLAACLRVPRVEPVSFVLVPGLPVDPQAELQAMRDRGRVDPVRWEGQALDDAGIRALPDEVAAAVWSTVRPWAHHAEIDMLVHAGTGLRPVSVIFGRRELDLAYGELLPFPPHGEAHPSQLQALASRHGLSEVVAGDAPWGAADAALLDRVLASLAPAEREVLAGTAWVRRGESPRMARELAWFDPTREPPRVEVYDAAFHSGVGAVGPVDAMWPAGAMTLLHEVGHALADWPLRQAYVAGRDLRALGRDGPVIDAWRAVRRGPGPTSYGPRQVHESFAEAFALHHLDPAALRRAMPEAADWFASSGHLTAAGLPGG